MNFKPSNTFILKEIYSLELNINPGEFGIFDTDLLYHIIGCEIFYCDLLIDVKIIVSEYQMCDVTDILQLQILQIIGENIIVEPKSDGNYKIFNQMNKIIEFHSTENMGTEDEIEIFKMI